MNNKKVVLVVGAGDATGGAIAKRFAQEGFVACVTRRSADKLQPLVDAIKANGGDAHGFACDARKEEDVIALVEAGFETFGHVMKGTGHGIAPDGLGVALQFLKERLPLGQ